MMSAVARSVLYAYSFQRGSTPNVVTHCHLRTDDHLASALTTIMRNQLMRVSTMHGAICNVSCDA
jgi:hypothetical protein